VVTAAKHARTAGAPLATSPTTGFNPWRDAIEHAHQRRVTRLTSAQLTAAERLLSDIIAAAEPHGVSLVSFDAVADLPTACLDVVATRDRLRTWRVRSFDRLHR